MSKEREVGVAGACEISYAGGTFEVNGVRLGRSWDGKYSLDDFESAVCKSGCAVRPIGQLVRVGGFMPLLGVLSGGVRVSMSGGLVRTLRESGFYRREVLSGGEERRWVSYPCLLCVMLHYGGCVGGAAESWLSGVLRGVEERGCE